jgi:anti-sigma-K factor RskA
MSETRDCGGDAAAYVLCALDPSEAEDFRRHMTRCVVCRDEVAAFRQAVNALPMAATQYPPPRRLRSRVMREVRAEPGLAARPPQRRRPLFSGGFVPRPALAAGLLAAVALAVLGGLELAPTGSSSLRVIRASVTAVSGSAQLRVAGAHAELIVSHFPPPAAGRIYEVWLKRGRQAPSPTRALFSVTSSGAAEVGVPGDVRGVSMILVTQEPAGGSLVPTRVPVIVARVT